MNTILAKHVPTKNTKNVWAIYMEGQEDNLNYCKSAYKAMRLMFLLKAKTGSNISGECLEELMFANRAAHLADELNAIEDAIMELGDLANKLPILTADA